MARKREHSSPEKPAKKPMSESFSFIARKTLSGELIDRLVRDISGRLWSDRLPGELRLVAHYGVSRGTLRKALEELESRGVISTSQGKSRRILLEPAPDAAPRLERIVFLSPAYGDFPAPDLMRLIHRLHVAAAEMDLNLVFRGRRTFQAKHPERLLQHLVDGQPNSLWILYHSTQRIQSYLQERGVAAIVIGPAADGVRFPSISIDYQGVARHAVARMLRAGIGRMDIALLMRRFHWHGWDRIVDGFRENTGGSERVHLHGDEPGALQSMLSSLMAGPNRPRGLLTWGAHDSLAACSWLTANGFRIPEDVAIIGTADARFLGSFTPALCRYDSPPPRFENQLIQWVRNTIAGNHPAAVAKVFVPEAIRGDTLPNGAR